MGKSENYGFFENDSRPEKRQMQTTNGVDVSM